MPTADMATTLMIEAFYRLFIFRHEYIDSPDMRASFLHVIYTDTAMIAAAIAVYAGEEAEA